VNKILFAILIISGSAVLGLFGAIDPFDLITTPEEVEAERVAYSQKFEEIMNAFGSELDFTGLSGDRIEQVLKHQSECKAKNGKFIFVNEMNDGDDITLWKTDCNVIEYLDDPTQYCKIANDQIIKLDCNDLDWDKLDQYESITDSQLWKELEEKTCINDGSNGMPIHGNCSDSMIASFITSCQEKDGVFTIGIQTCTMKNGDVFYYSGIMGDEWVSVPTTDEQIILKLDRIIELLETDNTKPHSQTYGSDLANRIIYTKDGYCKTDNVFYTCYFDSLNMTVFYDYEEVP